MSTLFDDDIINAAERVETFNDFLEFVSQLEHDFQTNGGTWSNQSIDMFFEACAGWANDSLEKDKSISAPSWRNFAIFLSSGTIYE